MPDEAKLNSSKRETRGPGDGGTGAASEHGSRLLADRPGVGAGVHEHDAARARPDGPSAAQEEVGWREHAPAARPSGDYWGRRVLRLQESIAGESQERYE